MTDVYGLAAFRPPGQRRPVPQSLLDGLAEQETADAFSRIAERVQRRHGGPSDPERAAQRVERMVSAWQSLSEPARVFGDAMAGRFDVAPTVPGQWSEEDEFRLRTSDAEARKRVLNLAEMVMGGTFAKAPAGALGAGPSRRGLPMDEASRMARAKRQRYAEEPFYRGEASGVLPNEYREGANFSRDKSVADGFARKGGQDEAREFRLDLSKALKDYEELTAEQYLRLVSAVPNRKLAADLVDQIAPGKNIDWFREFARLNPRFEITRGFTPMIRRLIETQTGNPVGVFTGAGFDALDSGRDVRKLDGFGIRLKDAAFDPLKRRSRDIMASLLAAAGVGAYSPRTPEPGPE